LSESVQAYLMPNADLLLRRFCYFIHLRIVINDCDNLVWMYNFVKKFLHLNVYMCIYILHIEIQDTS